MRNLSESGAKEQTVQEAKEEEPRDCKNPWLMLHKWNLECNHSGGDEHDRGHCKSETDSGRNERNIGMRTRMRSLSE